MRHWWENLQLVASRCQQPPGASAAAQRRASCMHCLAGFCKRARCCQLALAGCGKCEAQAGGLPAPSCTIADLGCGSSRQQASASFAFASTLPELDWASCGLPASWRRWTRRHFGLGMIIPAHGSAPSFCFPPRGRVRRPSRWPAARSSDNGQVGRVYKTCSTTYRSCLVQPILATSRTRSLRLRQRYFCAAGHRPRARAHCGPDHNRQRCRSVG